MYISVLLHEEVCRLLSKTRQEDNAGLCTAADDVPMRQVERLNKMDSSWL